MENAFRQIKHINSSPFSLSESQQAVVDAWIVNRIINENPSEFSHIRNELTFKVLTIPELIKRDLRWEIEEAIERNQSLLPIATVILSKDYIQ